MKSILNVDIKDDIKNQTIFFGNNSCIQRFDYYHYEKAKDLERIQRGAYWNPNEISLSNDILKYRTLPVSIQARFEANIAYQTLMDSGNNIGLDEALIPLVTSPEIMALLKTQSYFELIHSLSYAHNLITVFPDPSHIYDSISVNEFIKNRVNFILVYISQPNQFFYAFSNLSEFFFTFFKRCFNYFLFGYISANTNNFGNFVLIR